MIRCGKDNLSQGIRCFLMIVCIMCSIGYVDGRSWWNTDHNEDCNNNEGTDFWVTYMFNGGNLSGDRIDLKLRLFVTAREDAKVTIQYTDNTTSTFSVPAGGRSEAFNVDLSKAYIVNPEQVLSKGLHVTSDKPIALYAVNGNEQIGSQDATVVWPTEALHQEYLIQTYGTDGFATEFALVATKPTRELTIYI